VCSRARVDAAGRGAVYLARGKVVKTGSGIKRQRRGVLARGKVVKNGREGKCVCARALAARCIWRDRRTLKREYGVLIQFR
jgi:hypothetical protein